MAKAALFLAKKKLGFRGLLELIPLDPALVKGSHGLVSNDPLDQPVFIGPGARRIVRDTDVAAAILANFDCHLES